MKNLLLLLLASFLLVSNTFAQSDIRMRANYGSENIDLQSILQFEDIDLTKMSFSGNDLKDKDFQISIKEFVSGKLKKTKLFLIQRKTLTLKSEAINLSFAF